MWEEDQDQDSITMFVGTWNMGETREGGWGVGGVSERGGGRKTRTRILSPCLLARGTWVRLMKGMEEREGRG